MLRVLYKPKVKIDLDLFDWLARCIGWRRWRFWPWDSKGGLGRLDFRGMENLGVGDFGGDGKFRGITKLGNWDFGIGPGFRKEGRTDILGDGGFSGITKLGNWRFWGWPRILKEREGIF